MYLRAFSFVLSWQYCVYSADTSCVGQVSGECFDSLDHVGQMLHLSGLVQVVSNVPESIDFYTNFLGYTYEDANHLSMGSLNITFVQGRVPHQQLGHKPHYFDSHWAHWTDTFGELLSALKNAGYDVERMFTIQVPGTPLCQTFIRDPDGHLLEFLGNYECTGDYMKNLQEPAVAKPLQITRIQHIAHGVTDAQKSCDDFYTKFGFTRMYRPAFPSEGCWFDINDDMQLHLMDVKDPSVCTLQLPTYPRVYGDPTQELHKRDRWTFTREVKSEETEAQHQVNMKQIFVNDPDGHLIELRIAADTVFKKEL